MSLRDIITEAAQSGRVPKYARGRGTPARMEKARFIRQVRNNKMPSAWTCGRTVYWVSDSIPSQLYGHPSSYLYSRAFPDVAAGTYQHFHESGIDQVSIPPLRRAQFWKYLHRHLADPVMDALSLAGLEPSKTEVEQP